MKCSTRASKSVCTGKRSRWERRSASQVAAAISREEAVGDSNLIDSQPGVALQVQRLSQVYLKVAVRAGYPLAAVHVDRRHSFLWEATCSAKQEMFSHLAFMSVELANSFWPTCTG